ncbi:hypothetical protein [Dyadobacter bucti]|uniref:hypothetical protein n=1 Tax=Dyadobacter bucti TaxID=2572203 RepID=UPI0011094E1A|nr:hypothetical protein [Dyadobacter bucti]
MSGSLTQGERPGLKEGNLQSYHAEAFERDYKSGFVLLFKTYYAPLCSHAMRLVHSRQVAEELVSEVFYQFYITQAHKSITSSYCSYLFGSVRTGCHAYMRQKFYVAEEFS